MAASVLLFIWWVFNKHLLCARHWFRPGDKPDIPPPFGADHLMRERPQVCRMIDTPRSETNRKGDELVSGGLGAAF